METVPNGVLPSEQNLGYILLSTCGLENTKNKQQQQNFLCCAQWPRELSVPLAGVFEVLSPVLSSAACGTVFQVWQSRVLPRSIFGVG